MNYRMIWRNRDKLVDEYDTVISSDPTVKDTTKPRYENINPETVVRNFNSDSIKNGV